jgi:hypothetical protein
VKKTFISGSLILSVLFLAACNNSTEPKTHTHEDGSTHADHDTAKPKQQEFIIGDSTGKDSSSKEHTHKDGSRHSH